MSFPVQLLTWCKRATFMVECTFTKQRLKDNISLASYRLTYPTLRRGDPTWRNWIRSYSTELEAILRP